MVRLIPRVSRAVRCGVVRAAAVLLFVTAAAPALAQPPASTATGPLDPSIYATRLHDLAERIRRAEAGTAVEVEKQVPAVWRVQVEDAVVDVPGVWLQHELRQAAQSPDDWPRVRAHLLESLAAAERDARALATATPDEVGATRATLDAVLARPEFAQISRETAMARLQARMLEWFRRWWSRLGGDRLPVRSTATLFAWAASIAALAVLAGWATHMLRRASRARAGIGEPSASPRASADAWARQAVAAQDLRESVRYAYRALVSRFDEDGTWRADAARTPREYIRLLPRDHRRRPIVEDVARRFEEIWFGGRPATDDDRGAMIRRLRELGCLPAE
jgi:hypothetical protein